MRCFADTASKSSSAAKTSAARQRALTAKSEGARTISGSSIYSFDFNRIKVHSKRDDLAFRSRGARATLEKSVDDQKEEGDGIVVEKGPDAGVPPVGDAGVPMSPDAGVPAVKKKAGVDSFEVKWSKHPSAGPTNAELRLDYKATFTSDATHDPALADFRQSVFTKFEVTAGPNKGQKADTSPLHNDNYSRADDVGGNAANSTKFQSNDNPGVDIALDKNDVIDYAFTAQQTIIDTSDGNKVIATKGPHTGTISGKDPRVFGGVPATL